MMNNTPCVYHPASLRTNAGFLAGWCAVLALLAWSGCAPRGQQESSPAPAPKQTQAMSSLAAAAVAPVTTPQPALSTAPAARSLEPEPKGYDQKEMERVIQVLDWHAENFISKNNRVPTLEELRAWKDPDFPFPFREWPKPPPGKKWVMDKNSGQFRLAQQ